MIAGQRVMFLYWGRRGSLGKFARDLHAQALASGVDAVLSVSRQNEQFDSYAGFGPTLIPVDTFNGVAGAIAGLWRVPSIGKTLATRLRRDGIGLVVNLIPHTWTPLVVPWIRSAGATFVTMIHDAAPHPGDRLGLLNALLVREAVLADRVVTLSHAVREQLEARLHLPSDRIIELFHPDLDYGAQAAPPAHGEPLRLLFFGRVMRYKGLGLLAEAISLLQARGVAVELSVFGEGDLTAELPQLQRAGAKTVNRWISEEEVRVALAGSHVVALPYLEASQSGVASAAFASRVPVVATPVGGLAGQVVDGVNGLLASDVTAAAFADAVERLAKDRALYMRIVDSLASARETRSMERFLDSLLAAAQRP